MIIYGYQSYKLIVKKYANQRKKFKMQRTYAKKRLK